MKKIDTIKELRLIQMDIMSYVDRICRDNSIEYSLAGGTLIGAIRHKGFIPWDDDIDIMLVRDEYEKFIKVMDDDYAKGGSDYRIVTHEIDKLYKFPYAKVVNERTILKENAKGNSYGVYIDVFPVDYIPENYNKLLLPMRFLYNIQLLKRLKINNSRSFVKNLIVVVSQCILFPIPMSWIIQRMDRLAKRANKTQSKQQGIVVWGYGVREIVPSGVHENYIDVPFENRVFRSIKDYDVYLKCVYGNYMQLPPVDKQITHHDFEAYWKE